MRGGGGGVERKEGGVNLEERGVKGTNGKKATKTITSTIKTSGIGRFVPCHSIVVFIAFHGEFSGENSTGGLRKIDGHYALSIHTQGLKTKLVWASGRGIKGERNDMTP